MHYTRMSGLDGLRALAVIAVIVFHLSPTILPGGYVGVDVFFVISGFLITTLLIREHRDRGRISLRAFWVRRARRILPPLTVTVLVCTAAAIASGGELVVGIRSELLGAATFTSNWVAILQDANYMDALAPHLFNSLWSLAVEEQFYLLWPVILIAVLALWRGSHRVAATICIATAAASAVLMAVYYSPTNPSRAYLGTDSHLFGLMLGAALALTRTTGRITQHLTSRRIMTMAAGIIGVIVLIVAVGTMTWSSPVPFRGGLLLASLASTAVVNAVTVMPGVGRALDARPLRWVGVRSYSLYLWHWPTLLIVRAIHGPTPTDANTPLIIGLTLATTFAAAALTYRFVERPIMTSGLTAVLASLGRRRGTVLAVTAAFLTLVVGIGAASAPATSATADQILAGAEIARHTQQTPPPATPTPEPPVTPSVEPSPSATPPDSPAIAPPAPVMPTGDLVTVIGDSVTLASASALTRALPGVYIDAEVSRSMLVAVGILTTLQQTGQLRPFVVIALATNTALTAQAIDQVMAAVGPDRHVVFVNGHGPRSWIEPTNAQLDQASERHPGIVVADWDSAISDREDLLGSDHIHPTLDGATLYATVVTDALLRSAS